MQSLLKNFGPAIQIIPFHCHFLCHWVSVFLAFRVLGENWFSRDTKQRQHGSFFGYPPYLKWDMRQIGETLLIQNFFCRALKSVFVSVFNLTKLIANIIGAIGGRGLHWIMPLKMLFSSLWGTDWKKWSEEEGIVWVKYKEIFMSWYDWFIFVLSLYLHYYIWRMISAWGQKPQTKCDCL